MIKNILIFLSLVAYVFPVQSKKQAKKYVMTKTIKTSDGLHKTVSCETNRLQSIKEALDRDVNDFTQMRDYAIYDIKSLFFKNISNLEKYKNALFEIHLTGRNENEQVFEEHIAPHSICAQANEEPIIIRDKSMLNLPIYTKRSCEQIHDDNLLKSLLHRLDSHYINKKSDEYTALYYLYRSLLNPTNCKLEKVRYFKDSDKERFSLEYVDSLLPQWKNQTIKHRLILDYDKSQNKINVVTAYPFYEEKDQYSKTESVSCNENLYLPRYRRFTDVIYYLNMEFEYKEDEIKQIINDATSKYNETSKYNKINKDKYIEGCVHDITGYLTVVTDKNMFTEMWPEIWKELVGEDDYFYPYAMLFLKGIQLFEEVFQIYFKGHVHLIIACYLMKKKMPCDADIENITNIIRKYILGEVSCDGISCQSAKRKIETNLEPRELQSINKNCSNKLLGSEWSNLLSELYIKIGILNDKANEYVLNFFRNNAIKIYSVIEERLRKQMKQTDLNKK